MYKSKTRRRDVVEPRQISMHFMRKAGYGCTTIGRYFGLDHTTVLYSEELVTKMIETEDLYKERVEQLKIKVRQC